MFTVQNFLDLPAFQEFAIVSGHKGLTNAISSVNIMDNPDAIDWFSVGELLLTSGYFFKESAELQNTIMYQLKNTNCPGLCIKPQRYLGKIPENMIALSNELDLPIIQLSYGYSFSKIMTRVNEALSGKYDRLNRESIDIGALFFNLSLHGGGLKNIARTLAQLLESTVLLSDQHWNILQHEDGLASYFTYQQLGNAAKHPSDFLKSLTHDLPYELQQFQKPITRVFSIEEKPVYFIFMPVFFHGKHYGYIIICNPNNISSDSTYIALEQGAMAFALERIKNEEVIRAKNRVQRNFLEDLVTGQIAAKDELETWSEEHQIDLSLPYTAVVFEIDFLTSHSISDMVLKNQEENKQMKKLLNYLDWYREAYNENSLFFSKKNQLIFLLGIPGHPVVQTVRKCILNKVSQIKEKYPDLSLRGGIGQTAQHLYDIPTSYTEAGETLKMMDNSPSLQIGHFEDFIVHHLLFQNVPESDMKSFVKKILGPLILSKQKHPEEFLTTLESLSENRMNIAETARALFIHRNTLLYRKEKLEEILQLDFKSSNDLLKIELALEFRTYLSKH